jgi:hypothetical protein
MKYSAPYLKSPQYVAGSKVWSGGMTRSRKRGVSVSEEMAARSHGSPNSPASTSRRPQSAAPPFPLLSPAMNFGLWHISCSKPVHNKCLFRLLSSGIWVHVVWYKCNKASDGTAASAWISHPEDWSSMFAVNFSGLVPVYMAPHSRTQYS